MFPENLCSVGKPTCQRLKLPVGLFSGQLLHLFQCHREWESQGQKGAEQTCFFPQQGKSITFLQLMALSGQNLPAQHKPRPSLMESCCVGRTLSLSIFIPSSLTPPLPPHPWPGSQLGSVPCPACTPSTGGELTPHRSCCDKLGGPFHFHGGKRLSQSSIKHGRRCILGLSYAQRPKKPLVSTVNNHGEFA